MTADVLVVGAGPAGTTAALLLAKEGYDVALIDRAYFPRSKPCGEFVNPAACQLIERVFGISNSELAGSGGGEVHSVRLHLGRDTDLQVPILNSEGEPVYGVSAPRILLDELLARKCREAGVRLYEGHRVRNSCRSAGGIELRATDPTGETVCFRGKLLVGADGTHSILARQDGLTRGYSALQSIGVAAHLDGLNAACKNPSVWMFPSSGDGVMFGFARQGRGAAVLSGSVPKKFSREIASDARAFVHQWLKRYPHLLTDIGPNARIADVKTTACFGHRLKRCFAPRTLYVGDAAHFVDPFTGEGIHHAIENGSAAAEVAAKALRTGDVSERALAAYDSKRQGLKRRYLLCGLVRAFCQNPWLLAYVGERLRYRPHFAGILIGALADVLPANRVLEPGFILRALAP